MSDDLHLREIWSCADRFNELIVKAEENGVQVRSEVVKERGAPSGRLVIWSVYRPGGGEKATGDD